MNRLLFILIFVSLLTHSAIGQKSSFISVSGTDELKLGSWRFMPGDNRVWADSALNDRAWESITLDKPIDLHSATWKQNKGWFRQVIQPRSRIIAKKLFLVVKQFGASEVYMDGRLLAVLKPPQFDSAGSQRLIRFIPIQFADTNRHVLAIRYQLRRDPVVQAATEITPLTIRLQDADEAGSLLVYETEWPVGLNGFSIGIFTILALLHFLFYRANPLQSINRTLAWAMLFFGMTFFMSELSSYTGTLTHVSFTELISDISFHAGLILILTAVYQYLNFRRSWIYYIIITAIVVDQLYRIGVGFTPSSIAGVPYILTLADYIRVSWLGRKLNDTDARLPWNSLKAALYCFLIVLVGGITGAIAEELTKYNLFEYLFVAMVLLVVAGLFSIPVGLSLSLVRDYTRTHKALGDKLRQVEQLSAQTLAQEQEKQHMLAQQNEVLEQQVHARTAELHQSLADLKATQAQLVQREKLASLGELTAGIAHEIQNPLNFVNNFAEVSVELIDEINVERKKPVGERDSDLETDLLSDLGQNVQKISDHGKRAAGIVRGMLQHSRVSSGQKQSIDLNALVDEYLRLAYQGLRAKDKSFNAQLTTNFAPNLPTINLVPEDIGRVLVNLFNNAFYAVQQKSLLESGFVPTVSVQTAQDNEQLIIRVKDNGSGIPNDVRQKVFQPFFTTKPTGQGTGLGLSLSYDIVTKGHNGLLSLETAPGEFTEFTIKLPVK